MKEEESLRVQYRRKEGREDGDGGTVGAGRGPLSPVSQVSSERESRRLSLLRNESQRQAKRSISSHNRILSSKFYPEVLPGGSEALPAPLERDQAIRTSSRHNRQRQTIVLQRPVPKQRRKQGGAKAEAKEEEKEARIPFGFTLSAYWFAPANATAASNQPIVFRYVSNVALFGLAWTAGLRAGDIIVAVSGVHTALMEQADLEGLFQRPGYHPIRCIILRHRVSERVELAKQALQLRHLLHLRERALAELEEEEKRLLSSRPPSLSASYLSLPSLDEQVSDGTTDEEDEAESSGLSHPSLPSSKEAQEEEDEDVEDAEVTRL